MNLDLAYDIMGMLNTMVDAVKTMCKQYQSNDIQNFNRLSMDLFESLYSIQQIVKDEAKRDGRIRLADACTCAMDSLKEIKILVLTNPDKVFWKLECELLTIIETMMLQFFYWGIVINCPNERDRFYEMLSHTGRYEFMNAPDCEKNYEYDLTIWVTAYNHLDYTKQCVQSIFDNWPQGISTELILYNHGSSDGTKEYFESLQNAKVYNVSINGAVPSVAPRSQKGKYILAVSNDIIIGEYAIENMYQAISGNPDYGWVVPATPNISNLQSIGAEYSSREQMKEFMRANNVYDEKRHEERVRLCNPLHMMRADVMFRHLYEAYEEMICSKSIFSFPDDKCSLWMRRHGYKNILMKDSYCHHFGSVTLKHDLGKKEEQRQFYLEGRKEFLQLYGVDPWGPGVCYDSDLFQTWDLPFVDNALILGINCGLGSNSLKIKEILKEKGAKNLKLLNCTQEERYLSDLCGVSDEAYLIADLKDVVVKTKRNRFSFIIVDNPLIGVSETDTEQAIIGAGLACKYLVIKQKDGKWIILNKSND